MNIQLLPLLFLSLSSNAAAQSARDPMQEPREVVEYRPEISTSAPNGWRTEDLGIFTVHLPPEMAYKEGRGIDTIVGTFRSRKLKIFFMHSTHPETTESYYKSGNSGEIRRFLIAGTPADFIYPGRGFLAFFHPEYPGGPAINFTVTSEFQEELKTAELVLRTVRIKGQGK